VTDDGPQCFRNYYEPAGPTARRTLFIDLFLNTHDAAPAEIAPDLGAAVIRCTGIMAFEL
jgi:hypothetical protein